MPPAGLAVSHSEIFRKVRDFDYWAGMQGRRRPNAPPAAGAAAPGARPQPAKPWRPPNAGGQLKFYLTEILVVARKRTGP